MPTQPDSNVDNIYSANMATWPDGDETDPKDGWAVFSGTSAATPMVAGVAALLMQSDPSQYKGNPSAVKSKLMASCRDVTFGSSGRGDVTSPGPDIATGNGLVQAYLAVNRTDIWIKDNPDSDVGLVPTHNRRPTFPPHAHWVSPDIKLFSNQLTNPSTDFDSMSESEYAKKGMFMLE
jgi:subtilisin family serine protease